MEQSEKIQPTYLYERETAFFGWTPISYIDSVINIVNQYIHAALDSLQDFVDAELGEKLENEQGMQKTASLLESCVDKNFDRWELFCLQQVFFVPKAVELPEFADIDWSISEEEDKELDEKLAEIEERLFAAKQTRKTLQLNIETVSRRVKSLAQFTSKYAVIPETVKKHSIASLPKDCEYLSQQLTTLIDLTNKVKQYDDQIQTVHQLYKQKNASKSLDTKVDLSSAVKEEELYESLMRKIPLENLEVCVDGCVG